MKPDLHEDHGGGMKLSDQVTVLDMILGGVGSILLVVLLWALAVALGWIQ